MNFMYLTVLTGRSEEPAGRRQMLCGANSLLQRMLARVGGVEKEKMSDETVGRDHGGLVQPLYPRNACDISYPVLGLFYRMGVLQSFYLFHFFTFLLYNLLQVPYIAFFLFLPFSHHTRIPQLGLLIKKIIKVPPRALLILFVDLCHAKIYFNEVTFTRIHHACEIRVTCSHNLLNSSVVNSQNGCFPNPINY